MSSIKLIESFISLISRPSSTSLAFAASTSFSASSATILCTAMSSIEPILLSSSFILLSPSVPAASLYSAECSTFRDPSFFIALYIYRFVLRRRKDSNLRKDFSFNILPGCCLKPLGHASKVLRKRIRNPCFYQDFLLDLIGYGYEN